MDTPTILVINPNTSEDMTAAIDRVGQAAAGTSATVVTLRSQQGPHTIEGPLDAALGVPGMLEVVGAYTQPFTSVTANSSSSGAQAAEIRPLRRAAAAR